MRLLTALLLTAALSAELVPPHPSRSSVHSQMTSAALPLNVVPMHTGPPAPHSMSCYQCKGFGGCMRKSSCPQASTHCVSVATRPLNSPVDLPLVTKSCSSGCPNINNLAPHASLACCQASLCNAD
ncbi:PREDICTED: ly-6/neurotoxin-like protein 1-like [Elephantulus edwardii]|uniref:ly-6/neurotoxin-like protein 1-like n=1 Tax=Elephantulus edwardii TaxID=28737 RepID=UPI0003F0C12F|nr:PREDICTED: ly-6/neurotoxin-like protein 1-like [Elephantulus edwardii]